MEQHSLLTKEEEKIIREQIEKNSKVIERFVSKIDLLMNTEGHQNDSRVVIRLRKRLSILMEENDTFRRVYWKHVQLTADTSIDREYEAVRYLVLRIKNRSRFSEQPLFCEYEIGTN